MGGVHMGRTNISQSLISGSELSNINKVEGLSTEKCILKAEQGDAPPIETSFIQNGTTCKSSKAVSDTSLQIGANAGINNVDIDFVQKDSNPEYLTSVQFTGPFGHVSIGSQTQLMNIDRLTRWQRIVPNGEVSSRDKIWGGELNFNSPGASLNFEGLRCAVKAGASIEVQTVSDLSTRCL
jgi:hypothetical protein